MLMILSIFNEDNVFSMTANLPYGPPMNTGIGDNQTFISDFLKVLRHYLCDIWPVTVSEKGDSVE